MKHETANVHTPSTATFRNGSEVQSCIKSVTPNSSAEWKYFPIHIGGVHSGRETCVSADEREHIAGNWACPELHFMQVCFGLQIATFGRSIDLLLRLLSLVSPFKEWALLSTVNSMNKPMLCCLRACKSGIQIKRKFSSLLAETDPPAVKLPQMASMMLEVVHV